MGSVLIRFSNTLFQMMGGQEPGPLSLLWPAVESGISFPPVGPAPQGALDQSSNKDRAQAGCKPKGQARVRAGREAASSQQG